MASLLDVANNPHLMILLKGDPESGKTRFYSYFPGKILLLDFDRKPHAMIEVFKQLGRDPEKEVEYVYFSRNDMKKFEDRLERLLDTRGEGYGTIVVDSLTTLATHAVDYFNRFAGKERKEKKGEETGKLIGGIRIPGFEEYGGEYKILSVLIEVMMACDCHRILTAHVLAPDKPTWQRQIVTAGKKPAAMIPAVFPEIYHLENQAQADLSLPSDFVFFTKTHNLDFARTTLNIKAEVDWTNKNSFEILCKCAYRDGKKLYGSEPYLKDLTDKPEENLEEKTNGVV